MILLLCKPFTSNFEKYKNFFDKINGAYLLTDRFVDKATTLDKIETVPDKLKEIEKYLEGKSNTAPKLSGITAT